MKIATTVCLIAGLAMASQPANFSGKWVIQTPAGRGGGRGAPTVLVLNQAGAEVTGTITVRIDPGTSSPLNTEVMGGKVDGDKITFYVWTGTDQPVKAMYSGAMSAAGDEISFTVTGGRAAPGGFGGPGGGRAAANGPPPPMVAKRAR
jgi:hypothetical protein